MTRNEYSSKMFIMNEALRAVERELTDVKVLMISEKTPDRREQLVADEQRLTEQIEKMSNEISDFVAKYSLVLED